MWGGKLELELELALALGLGLGLGLAKDRQDLCVARNGLRERDRCKVLDRH